MVRVKVTIQIFARFQFSTTKLMSVLIKLGANGANATPGTLITFKRAELKPLN